MSESRRMKPADASAKSSAVTAATADADSKRRAAKTSLDVEKTVVKFKPTGCPYGDRCLYAHGSNEMREDIAGGTPSLDIVENPKLKTRMCRHWLSSNGTSCPHGIRCTYAHGPHELAKYGKMEYEERGPRGKGGDDSAPASSPSAVEAAARRVDAVDTKVITATATRNVAPPGLSRPPGLPNPSQRSGNPQSGPMLESKAESNKADSTAVSKPSISTEEVATSPGEVALSPEIAKALGLGSVPLDPKTLAMGPARPGPGAHKDRHTRTKFPDNVARTGAKGEDDKSPRAGDQSTKAGDNNKLSVNKVEDDEREYELQLKEYVLQDGRIDIKRMPASFLAKHLNRQFSVARAAAIAAGVDATIANAASKQLEEYVMKGGKLAGITSTTATKNGANSPEHARIAALNNTVTAGKAWADVVATKTRVPGESRLPAASSQSTGEEDDSKIQAESETILPASQSQVSTSDAVNHTAMPAAAVVVADSMLALPSSLTQDHDAEFTASVNRYIGSVVDDDDDYARPSAHQHGTTADGESVLGDPNALFRSLNVMSADPAYKFAISTMAKALNAEHYAQPVEFILPVSTSVTPAHATATAATAVTSPTGSYAQLAPASAVSTAPSPHSSLFVANGSTPTAMAVGGSMMPFQATSPSAMMQPTIVMLPNGQLQAAYPEMPYMPQFAGMGGYTHWPHGYPQQVYQQPMGYSQGGINIIPYPPTALPPQQQFSPATAGFSAVSPSLYSQVPAPAPRAEDEDEMTQRVALWGIDEGSTHGVMSTTHASEGRSGFPRLAAAEASSVPASSPTNAPEYHSFLFAKSH